MDKAESARDLWDHFQTVFQAKTNSRRLLLRQQLSNLKKIPSEPISKYLARANGLMIDLQAVGSTVERVGSCFLCFEWLTSESAI